MLILPVSRLEERNAFPLQPAAFEEQVRLICDQSRQVLEKEWLPSCADIFLEHKRHWKQYIPLKGTDSIERVQRFFACVDMLLSMQLRSLVMKSLRHFADMIMKFKVGGILGFVTIQDRSPPV